MRILCFLVVGILLFLSCESEPRPVDIAFDEAQVGGILRTQSATNLVLDLLDIERDIEFTLEYQDGQQIPLLSSVEMFISFVDNTPENGDNSQDFQEFRILSSTEFTEGVNGLPVIDISISAQELLEVCLLYTSPSPRDLSTSRMPSSA